MLDYQYHVMFASLALGLIFVAAYEVFQAHWLLSRLIVLFTILVFTPAAVVIMAHLREHWIGRGFYWDSSDRLWTDHRSAKTEKIELIVLVFLWSLIFLAVVIVVFLR